MESFWQEGLWEQFGAAMKMLRNALVVCPDELWTYRLSPEAEMPEFSQYWYVGFHTLFWLDYYLTNAPDTFAPPAPFSSTELDFDGAMPERMYDKAELLTYLEYGFEKCRTTIAGLTEATARERCAIPVRTMSVFELCLYNMRHVQEHASQLALVLGEKGVNAPDWVSRATPRKPQG